MHDRRRPPSPNPSADTLQARGAGARSPPSPGELKHWAIHHSFPLPDGTDAVYLADLLKVLAGITPAGA